jgi:hypothetical protein
MFSLKKINYLKLVKHSYSLAILIITITTVWFLFFLYKSVYLVMIQAEEVSELKTITIQEVIKKQKLTEIIAKINDKKEYHNQPQKSNPDPFYPQETIENNKATTSVNEITGSLEPEIETKNTTND